MNADIFDMLVGYFMDGTPLEAVPDEHKHLFSIRDNLTRLFNTRLGTRTHLHDYGLPDFFDIHISLPENKEEIADAILRTVSGYEPRFKKAEIADWSLDEKQPHLQCVIVGTLHNGEICRFRVTLTGMGENKVEFC